jgi:glutathione S-transferase
MLKLYGGERSRASIVQWYLEELNVPYEFILLDMQAGEHRQPEFLAINPIGKVPAIQDDDFILWESGAILLYIAEKYGNFPNSAPLKNSCSVRRSFTGVSRRGSSCSRFFSLSNAVLKVEFANKIH